jgi:hypothetical protein
MEQIVHRQFRVTTERDDTTRGSRTARRRSRQEHNKLVASRALDTPMRRHPRQALLRNT